MSEGTQRLIAIAALVVAVVAAGLDNLAFKEVDESPAVLRFVISAVVCVAVAAAIFLYLLPAARRDDGPANRLAQGGFVLGLAALASIIIFWTGLPFVLGAGAVVFGRLGEQASERAIDRTEEPETDDDEGQRATQAWAATLMGILAIVASVVLFVAVIVY